LKKLLREAVLSNSIEPLHEIYTVLKEKKKIPIEEFMSIVEKHYRKIDENVIKNILVWGAYLGLFKMSEDDTEIITIRE
jgi:hypothetical protein